MEVLFDDFKPDYWREAVQVWLMIWRFKWGFWSVLNKDCAYLIAKSIYRNYQPRMGSWMVTNGPHTRHLDTIESTQLTIRHGEPHWAWRGVGLMHVSSAFCVLS